jgi:hypothetical protein
MTDASMHNYNDFLTFYAGKRALESGDTAQKNAGLPARYGI